MPTKERNTLNPIVLQLKEASMLRAMEAARKAIRDGTLRAIPHPVDVELPLITELRVKF